MGAPKKTDWRENAMKAAYIEQVGPPQTIQYGDLPMPTVGRKDILVKFGENALASWYLYLA
jgi:hypothetical protein